MVVVGTWNLENLYRPGGAYGPATDEIYQAKLDTLAAQVQASALDVLAVQEVGQPRALDDLIARLGAGWTGVLSTHPDARGIRVGFVSTLPLAVVEQILAFPSGMSPVQVGDGEDTTARVGRGLLHVRVSTANGPLDLITAHLKSKLLTFPGGRFAPQDEDQRARFGAYAILRRAAEAATLRVHADAILDGHGQDRPLIVLGDLNDTPEAATTQILYGPLGSQYGTGGFDRADAGDAARLWNLAPRIPTEHRYTRINQGQPEVIDHLLISHQLIDRLVSVDAEVGSLTSITADPTARRDVPASDHAPVVARFTD